MLKRREQEMRVYSCNYDGRHRVVCAARSLAEFGRILGFSGRVWRNYAGQTWNAQDVAAAVREPGVPFYRRETSSDGPLLRGLPDGRKWRTSSC